MPALKCMIALDRSSSYCKCSQGGITNKADMLKNVAPVIPSLNTFYLSGCKSHAGGDTVQFWLVCTCFYFIIIMMNKKNGYVLTFSGMLIYLHTQGALCDLLLLLSTNLNQMMWKKTFPFLARVFHHCLLVLRARRKSCKRCCCRVVSSCKLTFSLL